jgi:hypothetical protein
MTNEIKVIDDRIAAEEYIIPQAKAEGYMAWYSPNINGPHYWSQAFGPVEPVGERDPYKCPYPLFPTREKAIEAASRTLQQGGICKIVRIIF